MKKIFALVAVILAFQAAAFAQKNKTVAEQDVPERYVKDFQRQAPEAKNPVWISESNDIYMVKFDNGDQKQSFRFSPKGMETRWAVDTKFTPQAIKDTVAHKYKKYKIRELNVMSIKNHPSYEVRISLSKKKDKSPRILTFETDGKFIDDFEAMQ